MTWLMNPWSALLITLLLSPATGLGQSSGLSPRGLLVSKDLQTGYVEIFEYVTSQPVNALVTQYQLTGGLIRQVPKAAQMEEVRYPRSATSPAPAAELANDLHQLDALAQRYPQYASILAPASTRLRQIPVQAAPASTPVAPAPGTIPALVLRNGMRYQNVKILHTDGDWFAISHRSGVAEVLFSELPTDPNSLPPELQALIKAHQAQVVAAEAQKKQAAALAAAQAPPLQEKTGLLSTDVPPFSGASASSSVTRPVWRNSVFPGLTVKGLSIGMDGAEAAKALIEQGQGKLAVKLTPIPNQHGYEAYLLSNGQIASGMIGHLRIDPRDGTVTAFFFEPELSNLLFNTADQSAEEFARAFINAYNVPRIEPTIVGINTPCWSHTSAEGWTLYIYTDKAVEVKLTPSRKFD